jgi:predicted small secreted protein
MNTILRVLQWSLLVCALLGAAGTLVGCGTIHGVGEDVQSIGKGLQEPFE